MKAVATALAVCIAPGFLLGCASGPRSHSPSVSGQVRQGSQYESDWLECRRYAMIDSLLLPDPKSKSGPSGGAASTPGHSSGAVSESSDEVAKRCMETRGYPMQQ